jgi:sugar lactone lactonase YvrE
MRAALLALMMMAAAPATAEDLKLADAQYPEGALWYEGRLYFEEMWPNLVRVSDLKTTRTLWSASDCSPVNIAPYQDGFVVLCHMAHKLVRISREGKTIGVIDRDSEGRAFVYPNGAAADGEGGVYFTSSGTFDPRAPAEGAVLYLAADGRLSRVAEGVRYANGIAVDAVHKRVLVSAHLAREVLAYPLLGRGVIGKPSTFFSFAANGIASAYPLAGPDGMEIDGAGDVIVAEYGAARLHKIAPDGTWLGAFTGVGRFVTDVALLPGDRAVITAPRSNSKVPLWGDVTVSDHFLERFKK